MTEPLISRLASVLEESRKEYETASCGSFVLSEEMNRGVGKPENILALGDNLRFMKSLLQNKDMAGKIDLIYIDPPFFSKGTYDSVINLPPLDGRKLPPIRHFAYDDVWQKDAAAYLKMLCTRFFAMKELLSETGTIWVHLDWHAVHYVKVLLDAVFGEENFVNEIIWYYKSGGSGKRHFSRKHDTILVYGKSKSYYFSPPKEKSYNRGFKPYRFKNVKEYRDEQGWYTMVTMKDVWQIDMVGRTSSERTGYATQKPEALIERMLLSASEEGSLCADFFCGSGTLAAAAEKMGRRWICCDESPLAVASTLKRLFPKKASLSLLEEASAEGAGVVAGSESAAATDEGTGESAAGDARTAAAAGKPATGDGTVSAADEGASERPAAGGARTAESAGKPAEGARTDAAALTAEGAGRSAACDGTVARIAAIAGESTTDDGAVARAAATAGESTTADGVVARTAAADCRCDFTARWRDVAGADKELLEISLTGYRLEKLPDGIDAAGEAVIEEVLQKEPLALLQYWSVDLNYDGKVFRPEAFFSRDRKGMPLACEMLVPAGSRGRICVRAVDVFGNGSLNVREV